MRKGRKPPWLPQHPILVIGDFCIDAFTQARAVRISREQPVPVFVSGDRREQEGCGGNVARQVEALLVPAVLQRLGSTRKERVLAGEPLREVFRLDHPWPSREDMPYFWTRRCPPSAVVFVDYQGIPPSRELVEWMLQWHVPLIGDSHCHLHGWQGFDLVKISEEDIAPPVAVEVIERLAGHRAFVITRGAKGHTLVTREAGPVDILPHPPHGPVANVSGAGDIFTATAAVALAGGQTVEEATRLAGIAASLRVMKPEYNATVTWEEICR